MMDGIAAAAIRLRGSMSPAVCLVLIGTAAVTASGQDRSAQTATVRPSFDMRVEVSPTPVAVDGALRLVYELHLTNYARAPLTVRQVEVLDDATVIADLRADELEHRLGGPASSADDDGRSRSIAPGMHAVLYLELPIETEVSPRVLEHRVTYHVTGEDAETAAVVRGARVRVNAEPHAMLGPPLRGGPWAAVYPPCLERGHRRVFYAVNGRAHIPHRFAIDWVKMDSDGRFARGDPDQVASWYGYGAEVLAVADGIVAATRNHLTESATVSGRPRVPLEESQGNFIVLDLGDGRYAFYGHLQPVSVRVQPGDRVRRGQVIGAVGFTGSAAGPQLHFHVADANSFFDAEGVPFEIDSFDLLGTLGSGNELADCADPSNVLGALGNTPWTPVDGRIDSQRTGELPAPYAVVDFETSGAR